MIKRDMDLIRKILLFAEEHCDYSEIKDVHVEIDDASDNDISFHIALLLEGKMVIAFPSGTVAQTYTRTRDRYPSVFAITWQGYEFLDKIRDDKQWKRIKGILSKTGDFSYEAVNRAASSIIADQLKHFAPACLSIIVVYLAGLLTKPFWK